LKVSGGAVEDVRSEGNRKEQEMYEDHPQRSFWIIVWFTVFIICDEVNSWLK
jgi:hypothetical protein